MMITDGLTPLGLLLFLALVGGSLLAGLTIVGTLALRKRKLAKLLVLSLLGGWAAYGLLLVTASVTSTDRVLGMDEEKHICEIDCHTAYAVIKIRTSRTIGTGSAQRTAQGIFYVVTLRVRFDSLTISSHRGMAPLSPGGRDIAIVDRRGHTYVSSPEGQQTLESAQGKRTPLTRSLVPGESYATDLVFDIPPDAADLRLQLTAATGLPDRLIIGYENSLFHKKTTFRLTADD